MAAFSNSIAAVGHDAAPGAGNGTSCVVYPTTRSAELRVAMILHRGFQSAYSEYRPGGFPRREHWDFVVRVRLADFDGEASRSGFAGRPTAGSGAFRIDPQGGKEFAAPRFSSPLFRYRRGGFRGTSTRILGFG